MAYVTPGTVAAGDVATAAAWNVIANDVIALAVPPACRLTNSSNLTGYTINTDITWAVEAYDTNGMHSTVTNTGRITAQTAGIYLVTGQVYATFGTTPTQAELYAIVNGSLTNQVAFDVVDFGSQTNVSVLAGAGVVYLGVNDYVSMRYSSTGTSIIIQAERSYLSATWLGNSA